jgi:enoyl-CoA hydratase/carnithine racemase
VEVATVSATLVDYRVEHGIAILELNNPPVNAYTYEMMRALDACILQARFDPGVSVLVIRGKGERFFCAGADIHMLHTTDATFKYYFVLHAHETLQRLEHTPKLVIAALNGATAGGGLELALACDLRLAKRDGGRIGLPEIALGIMPGTGGTQRLPRLVGKARALELMATGRLLAFEEALDMGLIDQILEPEDFFEQVLDYARQFTPPGKASKAVGGIKRAVCAGLGLSLPDALALEREIQQQLFESPDASEGLAAYVEKRMPRFRGV